MNDGRKKNFNPASGFLLCPCVNAMLYAPNAIHSRLATQFTRCSPTTSNTLWYSQSLAHWQPICPFPSACLPAAAGSISSHPWPPTPLPVQTPPRSLRSRGRAGSSRSLSAVKGMLSPSRKQSRLLSFRSGPSGLHLSAFITKSREEVEHPTHLTESPELLTRYPFPLRRAPHPIIAPLHQPPL